MSDEKECNFLGGFLLGSLIGVVLAALMTPSNGNENQDNLLTAYKTGLDKAKDLKEKTKHSIDELKQTTQQKAKHLLIDLKDKAENIVNRFDNMTAKGASVLIDDEIV